MSTKNITTYIKDTRQNILNSSPNTTGEIKLATDTNSLFVSDGDSWIERPADGGYQREYQLTGDIKSLHTPYSHFDASDVTTVINASDGQASDGQSVKQWINKSGAEHMISTDTGGSPVYVANDTNGNSGISLTDEAKMMLDPDNVACRTGEFTFIAVYTHHDDAEYLRSVSSQYTKPVYNNGSYISPIFSTNPTQFVSNGGSGDPRLGIYPTNQYTYIRTSSNSVSIHYTNTGSEQFDDIDGSSINGVDFYNTRFIGKPHVYYYNVCMIDEHRQLFANQFGTATYANSTGNPVQDRGTYYRRDMGMPIAHTLAIGKDLSGESHGTLHELIAWNHSLTNNNIHSITEHLATKWNADKFYGLI